MRGQHSIILIYICMKRHILFQRIVLALAILTLARNGLGLKRYSIDEVRWKEKNI